MGHSGGCPGMDQCCLPLHAQHSGSRRSSSSLACDGTCLHRVDDHQAPPQACHPQVLPASARAAADASHGASVQAGGLVGEPQLATLIKPEHRSAAELCLSPSSGPSSSHLKAR